MIDNDPRQIEMPLDDRKRCIKGNKTITTPAEYCKKYNILAALTPQNEAEEKND